MGQFDSAIDLAKRLLAKYGESSQLVRTIGGAPSDPNKTWEPGAPVVTNTTVSTVWLDRSILRRDDVVKEGQAMAILAAKDLAVVPDPATDHIRRADNTRYAIVETRPLDPNGQKIIFELVVKR